MRGESGNNDEDPVTISAVSGCFFFADTISVTGIQLVAAGYSFSCRGLTLAIGELWADIGMGTVFVYLSLS